ncbi:thiamine biosynthesis protein ThiS [Endozoicomonas montiporae]|uniref:Thiamine biosynthesis protein ThiS n=2 Tax=Endozoicomonas montiporae TaxID=1027273 RepID=A0A081N5P4_9GAMM|nr:sulfur carrier protein ThiS [Endozoicomonas montiporae]AMO57340.1 sulfur carrier protein ThiS [Endozoicomonas montiporae CL-33]KEQ13767.1 thiamine biosynthesis protein ThiS [Endozoicomonas montiporae]
MQIKVNDQPVTVEGSLNIRELLKVLSQAEKGIALAVNSQIISRSQWENHSLRDGDQITLIKATAGG